MCVRHLDEILNDDAVASHDATKLRLLSLFFLRFPTEALEHQNEMLYTLADVSRRSCMRPCISHFTFHISHFTEGVAHTRSARVAPA